MSKKYIVMERGYEHNDEGYERQDGGDPLFVFDSEAGAKLGLMAELTNSRFLYALEGQEIEDADEIDEAFPGVVKWCEEEHSAEYSNCNWVEGVGITGLSGEDIAKLYKALDYDPLYIVEVEGE